MQIKTLYKFINLWILLLFFMGCSQTHIPPSTSVIQPASAPQPNKAFTASDISIPEPCKGIKIVGELTPFEFEKFFQCLNQKGALNELSPLVLGNAEGTAFFTKLYNESFSASPTARKETLELIHSLNKNKGLSDLLKVLSLFISEFFDTSAFV